MEALIIIPLFNPITEIPNLPNPTPVPTTSTVSSNPTMVATPTINPSPNVPELSWTILPLLAIATLIGSIVLKRKQLGKTLSKKFL